MTKYRWAYSRLTGRKRAIPETWLTTFPQSWAQTPSSREAVPDPVDHKTPTSPTSRTQSPSRPWRALPLPRTTGIPQERISDPRCD